MNVRDESLGRAIDALDVPDHQPDFWSRLDEEPHDETVVRPIDRGRERTRRRPQVGSFLGVAALVLVLAAAVAVVIGMTDRPAPTNLVTDPGPGPDRGLDPGPDIGGLMTMPEYVSGTVTVGDALEPTVSRFWGSRDGSFRLESPEYATGYDAETATWWSVSVDPDTGKVVGFADEHLPVSALRPTLGYDTALAAHALALHRAGEPGVTEATWRGRPSLELDVDTTPNAIAGGYSHIVAVVDRATGLVVESTRTGGDGSVLVTEVTELLEDGEPPVQGFLPPADADLRSVDQGFSLTTIDEVRQSIEIDVAVPQDLPAGFELVSVWAAVDPRMFVTGAEGSNPLGKRVVVVEYRRGWERVWVMTQATGSDPGLWSNPYGSEGNLYESREQELDRGALAGSTAEIVVDPNTAPHAWAAGPKVVLSIIGSLTDAELVTAMQSLTIG